MPDQLDQNEIDKVRLFLEQWELDTQPIHEMILKTWDNGHAFSKLGLQTMFYLNGGGLVAFPTFMNLAKVEFSQDLILSLATTFSFVAGLIFATIATVLAYFTCGYQSEGLFQSQEIRKNSLHLTRPCFNQSDVIKKRNEAEIASQRAFRIMMNMRWAAIIFALLSLLAFITGTIFAALALLPNKGMAI